jgi:tRNA (mo5U34)-methyltransferase
MPASAAAVDVSSMRWYHTLELPGGVVTPGEYDLRGIVRRLPFPPLEGLRCLDIGSRDGFFAFEMERRGAGAVVSVDISDPALVDFTGPRPPDEVVQGELDAGNDAFETARSALGSGVERVYESIYDLDRDAIGGFDFVFIGTLLLHLRDPARALAAVRAVTDGRLLVNEPVVSSIDAWRRRPLAEAYMRKGPFWSIYNPAGLRQLLTASGFVVTASSRPYLVPWGAGGPRSSLRSALIGPPGELPRRLIGLRGWLHAWVLAAARPEPP